MRIVRAPLSTGPIAARNGSSAGTTPQPPTLSSPTLHAPAPTLLLTQSPPSLGKAVAGTEPIAAIYASLDTDLLFIPVFTKYVWSAAKPEGALTEGGMFSGSEIVVQSGTKELGQWFEEKVNVYEDFKRIHHHEPAAKAWGISIIAGPGVDIDFATLVAMSGK